MPPSKLTGPCVLHHEGGQCRSGSRAFRRITDLAFSKIHPCVRQRHPDLVRDAIVCHGHYMKYVEAGRGGNSRPYWEREKLRILGTLTDCKREEKKEEESGGKWREVFDHEERMLVSKNEPSGEMRFCGGLKKQEKNVFPFIRDMKTLDGKFPCRILPRRILPSLQSGSAMRRLRELYERGKRPRGRPRNEMNEYIRSGFDPQLFQMNQDRNFGTKSESNEMMDFTDHSLFKTRFPSSLCIPKDPPLFHCPATPRSPFSPSTYFRDYHPNCELVSIKDNSNQQTNIGTSTPSYMSLPSASALSSSTSTLNRPRSPKFNHSTLTDATLPNTRQNIVDEDDSLKPARLLLLLASHKTTSDDIPLSERQSDTEETISHSSEESVPRRPPVTLPSIRNLIADIPTWPQIRNFDIRSQWHPPYFQTRPNGSSKYLATDELILPPPNIYRIQKVRHSLK